MLISPVFQIFVWRLKTSVVMIQCYFDNNRWANFNFLKVCYALISYHWTIVHFGLICILVILCVLLARCSNISLQVCHLTQLDTWRKENGLENNTIAIPGVTLSSDKWQDYTDNLQGYHICMWGSSQHCSRDSWVI